MDGRPTPGAGRFSYGHRSSVGPARVLLAVPGGPQARHGGAIRFCCSPVPLPSPSEAWPPALGHRRVSLTIWAPGKYFLTARINSATFGSGAAALICMGQFGGSNLSSVFLAGGAGIIFGILALLGIEPGGLTAIALIVFGGALVLGSNAVWHLYTLKHAAMTSGAAEPMAGTEVLASQMASGSAGIQAIAGIAAVVLGILALAGTGVDSVVLILVGLLIVGITIVLSGSAWSGTVMSFMRETTPEPGHSPVTSSPRPSAEWRREEH
jgi:hypothetical protein